MGIYSNCLLLEVNGITPQNELLSEQGAMSLQGVAMKEKFHDQMHQIGRQRGQRALSLLFSNNFSSSLGLEGQQFG